MTGRILKVASLDIAVDVVYLSSVAFPLREERKMAARVVAVKAGQRNFNAPLCSH